DHGAGARSVRDVEGVEDPRVAAHQDAAVVLDRVARDVGAGGVVVEVNHVLGDTGDVRRRKAAGRDVLDLEAGDGYGDGIAGVLETVEGRVEPRRWVGAGR